MRNDKDYAHFVWHISDVQNEHSDLTDEQAREVLQYCHDNHDASIGMNWDVIDSAVSTLGYEQ